jgi:uncharacterized OB-fold protein
MKERTLRGKVAIVGVGETAYSHADNVRMIGNLLGDPHQDVSIGAPVEAVFEAHDEAKPPFTLVHWRRDERPR